MDQPKAYYGDSDYRAACNFAAEIDGALLATDPRFKRHVLLIHEEGTTLYFRFAFILRLDEWLLVFTEHHRYHVYHETDLLLYKQFNPGKALKVPRSGLDVQRVQELFTTWFVELSKSPIRRALPGGRRKKPAPTPTTSGTS
jgi:hypothetical protein